MKRILCLVVAAFSFFPLHADDAFPYSTRSLAIDAMNEYPSDQNWVFSPLSASAALSMVYAGSDGRTAEELRQVLHLFLPQESVGTAFHNFSQDLLHFSSNNNDFELRITQGIWSQRGFLFLNPFISSMREDFKAQIESIDFSLAAIEQINGWIADHTEHKIENLFNLNDLDSSTRLVLANAIYFKGKWINPFQPDSTRLAPFRLSTKGTKEVKMIQQFSQFPYFEDADWQAIVLPFERDRLVQTEPACLLLLSKHADTSPCLSAEKLELILSSCKRRMIHLLIPRFKFEQRIDLQDWLSRLGIRNSFSPLADFSKMDGKMDLCLSKVVQKCIFSLDEQGVEAAAATGAAMNMKCCGPSEEEAIEFIADRPFEFLLIDQISKTCLMVGHVADPLQ